jgi:hypothetical protein
MTAVEECTAGIEMQMEAIASHREIALSPGDTSGTLAFVMAVARHALTGDQFSSLLMVGAEAYRRYHDDLGVKLPGGQ